MVKIFNQKQKFYLQLIIIYYTFVSQNTQSFYYYGINS